MAESLYVDLNQDRASIYSSLYPQMKALIEGETHPVANMANFCAVLKSVFDWHWIGFYTVIGDELVLGPFQGPIACTRLYKGKGVCAAAWESKSAVLVDDVEAFPGHVACSSFTQSELVIPLFDGACEVWAVLDLDSTELAGFDDLDRVELEKMLQLIPAP